jgi:hypothetical protein
VQQGPSNPLTAGLDPPQAVKAAIQVSGQLHANKKGGDPKTAAQYSTRYSGFRSRR